MSNDKEFSPIQFKGVMVSSTFADLETHRQELMKALRKEELFAIGMEEYVPVPGDDIISSSLDMVRKGSAYIGLISRRCGQIIECPERNVNSYSVSRLEFEEAQRLGLPTLIFVMGENHPVTESGVELESEKREKLKEYRELAKEGRIYEEFDSLEDFKPKAIHAVARLARYLREQDEHVGQARNTDASSSPTVKIDTDPIPSPPTFYAEPPYIGSHDFVGRKAELDRLSDWASPPDPHPLLLFEAIGGTGKSMLTWEWATRQSTEVRKDWAGGFWYSFYEKGAVMSDFCQRALAYMTGRPLKEFRRKRIALLGEQLLRHLQDRPWLLVLDGLERVLVAYHRFDAAQVADEDADTSEDQIATRDPCRAIRPEDDDLLHMFAAAGPSKILITTRLIPRILLNRSGQAIPGVLRVSLPGLRPSDAEDLLRSCDITGSSQKIQDYLKSHCDCHPLVTGVLAGLINDYLPDRGNFDSWAGDKTAGGQLNLADLDLVQKRNHILLAALAALPEKSRQLLSTLAVLSESVDFETLSALNPHLPPEPETVEDVEDPEDDESGNLLPKERKRMRQKYLDALEGRRKYEQIFNSRPQDLPTATKELSLTVQDLERRGLLQYDHASKRYDLHPVVRGVATGKLGQKDKERYGQRVVDYFSQRAHIPYAEAETLEDLRDGLHVVRTLLQMGRYEQACDAYLGKLCNPLLFNLEAYAEVLSLERPFFPKGWDIFPKNVSDLYITHLAGDAAKALAATGELKEALKSYGACIRHCLTRRNWTSLQINLSDAASVLYYMNRLATMERLILFSLEIASNFGKPDRLFKARLVRFRQLNLLGQYVEGEAVWRILDPMGRNWPRATYRPGEAEFCYASFHFCQGTLNEEILRNAEHTAKMGKTRRVVRGLHRLRGNWQIEKGQWAQAAKSCHEAVRMAREVGQNDFASEAMLCLAKFHLGQLSSPRDEAVQLAKRHKPAHQPLAELWSAIGDGKRAKKHALLAYRAAWADGEPYVYRYDLNKARALLKRLGADIPDLSPYDPAKDEKFPWEDDVAAAIGKLRAEKRTEGSYE
jgi:hypothetical protein